MEDRIFDTNRTCQILLELYFLYPRHKFRMERMSNEFVLTFKCKLLDSYSRSERNRIHFFLLSI